MTPPSAKIVLALVDGRELFDFAQDVCSCNGSWAPCKTDADVVSRALDDFRRSPATVAAADVLGKVEFSSVGKRGMLVRRWRH